MPPSYRFTVSGRVQGVGFRYTAVAQARRHGVSGWIGNRADGAVEGLAGGAAPEKLEAFREWLGRGPPFARVERVEWTESAEPVGVGFEIRR
ncbi:MAG: acylphosphatase [Gammaproteobacteria bacterium]